MTKATLTFDTRNNAEIFAKAWSRKSLMGHTIGAGTQNVKVSIYNITDDLKKWVDDYVAKMNEVA